MRYRNFLAPIFGLALASVAAAQTPTTPQPATPRSDPGTPQPATTPYEPAAQTPMNPPAPATSPSWNQQRQGDEAQEPMHRAPEMAFVQAHLDTVLQGVSLTYSQYRRIDSTAMRQIASAGFGRRGMGRDGMGRDGMGRDGMGRDGRSNNTNCGVNAQPTMPGSTASNCPPNQSGSGYPQRDTSATGSSSTYPQSGQQPGSSSYPGSANSGTTNQYDRGARGMGDTLSTSDRSRLLPVLDQIDAAIRPVLSAAQQRTFDRNISTWKRNHAVATY